MSANPVPQVSDVGIRLADVFRWHPAGVAVLTADGPTRPVGMTVSSLTSVSVVPPMVSVSMANSSTTLAALHEGDRAVIHPLDTGQQDLADSFARHGVSATGIQWQRSAENAPQLDVETPRLHAVVTRMVDVGTATVVVLTVERIEVGRRGAAALVRMGRGWYSVPR
ncbi:flavin reductase [Acidipropionibacterium virtanenii]|uniref:FMN reductase (NADH) RutF n=1 Tax=Acidipropionibacterium virtanenii TaxID=2057246 RepID=A0A344UWS7_9ACTN|nr:flavin reductase [Acidipropionibacterium virtanenii]AXE39725.1 FMN reductase (NADH) RutF [Acidipropionibacterium virtanenii]